MSWLVADRTLNSQVNKITTELQAIVQLELGVLLLGLLSLVMMLDLDGDLVSNKLHVHGRIYSRAR
jgi:hypothetical protein